MELDINTPKLILSFMLFFLVFNLSEAQNDTIWYDSNWKEETNKLYAHYFRPEPKLEGNGYRIIDYYISGKKQMEGVSTSKNSSNWIGKVIWYYPNEIPSSIRYFSEENKQIKEESYYINNQLKYILNFLNNKINGEFKSYHPNGILAENGQYKDNQKIGKWIFYNTNGELIETKEFN